MTSVKKPLIAIASAIALIGSVLVAAPASALATDLTVGGSAPATAGTSIATAVVLPVPSDNDVSSSDALRIAISDIPASSTVTATATNAKLTSKVTVGADVVKVDAGTSTLSVSTGTGTTADIFVFTTSTEAGSVSVSVGGNTTVYHVAGTAGPAYNLGVVASKVADINATTTLKATVTDVFGNAVAGATITTTVIGATVGAYSYDATDKVYKATLTTAATSGSAIVESKIAASEVVGLAKPVTSVISTIAVGDLASQIAALTAQISVLEAAVAAKVTKKRFNTLARKWNKAFPSKKVALKQ